MLARFRDVLVNLYLDEEGASFTEYLLLGALVAVGGIVGATMLGIASNNHLNNVGDAVATGVAASAAASSFHPLAPAAAGSIVAAGACGLALARWRAAAKAALTTQRVPCNAPVHYTYRATHFLEVQPVRTDAHYDLESFPADERLVHTAPHDVQQLLSQLRKNA
jgi:Flp pilus assembly pilin Flp